MRIGLLYMAVVIGVIGVHTYYGLADDAPGSGGSKKSEAETPKASVAKNVAAGAQKAEVQNVLDGIAAIVNNTGEGRVHEHEKCLSVYVDRLCQLLQTGPADMDDKAKVCLIDDLGKVLSRESILPSSSSDKDDLGGDRVDNAILRLFAQLKDCRCAWYITKYGEARLDEIEAIIQRSRDTEVAEGDAILKKIDQMVRLSKVMSGCLSDAEKGRLVADLGKVLIGEAVVRFGNGGPRGLLPYPMLEQSIVELFNSLNDSRAILYLIKYYEARRDRSSGWSGGQYATQIAALISRLGGTVQTQPTPASVPVRKADADETAALIGRLANEKMNYREMYKVFQRLEQIGDESAAVAIAQKLLDPNLDDFPKTEGIMALGSIGGPTAIAALVRELERPMPPGANVNDNNCIEAGYRGRAAMCLGQIGNPSVLPLLERLDNDPSQFYVVHREAKKAIRDIRSRFPDSGVPGPTSAPATSPGR